MTRVMRPASRTPSNRLARSVGAHSPRIRSARPIHRLGGCREPLRWLWSSISITCPAMGACDRVRNASFRTTSRRHGQVLASVATTTHTDGLPSGQRSSCGSTMVTSTFLVSRRQSGHAEMDAIARLPVPAGSRVVLSALFAVAAVSDLFHLAGGDSAPGWSADRKRWAASRGRPAARRNSRADQLSSLTRMAYMGRTMGISAGCFR